MTQTYMTQTYRVLGLIRGEDFDGVQLKPVNGGDAARLGADSIRLDYGHGLRPGDVVQVSVRMLQRPTPAPFPTAAHKGRTA